MSRLSRTASTARHHGLIVPPAIAGLGWTQKFFDDFTSAATITGNTSFTTLQAGVKWYPGRNVTETDPTNYHVLTATTAAGISNGNSGGGTNASPSGGILQITGNSGVPNQGNLISTTQALNQTPGSGGGFGPTGYWEGYMQYPSSGTAHVSFWTLPLALNTSTITELDLVEINITGSQPNYFIGNFNQWTANFGADTFYTSCNQAIAKNSNWHTYGMMVTDTGGGHATVSAYLDNVFVGSVAAGTGTNYVNVLTDPSGAVTRYFLLGKNNDATVVNFDWVRYWGP